MALTLPAPGIHVCSSPGNFGSLPGGPVIATVDGVDYEISFQTSVAYPHSCHPFPHLTTGLAAVPITSGYAYLVYLGNGKAYEINEKQAEAFSWAWQEYEKFHQTPPTSHLHTRMRFFQTSTLKGYECCEIIDGAWRPFFGSFMPSTWSQAAPTAQVPATPTPAPNQSYAAQVQVLSNMMNAAFPAPPPAPDIYWRLEQLGQQVCECGAHKAMGLKPGQAGHARWCPAC